MSYRSSRSTGPSTDPGRARRGGADVYLFPAVVGGGLGDIEEVLAAGRCLARAGFPIFLYRGRDRPLPRSVEGPWDWPPLTRIDQLRPTASAALTVSPSFGLSAARHRPGPLGREGPWAVEAQEVEASYGPGRTLHVSLEEFARTLTSREETRERLREGGVRSRALAAGARRARAAQEEATFRVAFERFRAFERADVLHLYATFRPNPAFAREFPSAVQVSPLWSEGRGRVRRGKVGENREWVWYASPASAERIAPSVAAGLHGSGTSVRVHVRSPRPWHSVPAESTWSFATLPEPSAAWRRRFAEAEVRIVTGSRSLLEAIEVGGPFLYFNGILGEGSRARRHRPEKLRALLDFARTAGLPDDVRRDLADFGRGRRVADVVGRVASHSGGWRHFALAPRSVDFRPPFHDAGALVVAVARSLARSEAVASEVVARVRRGSNP